MSTSVCPPGQPCGSAGTCVNTSTSYECLCTPPWTNIGDFFGNIQSPCLMTTQGRTAVWVINLLVWIAVLCSAAITAWRMSYIIHHSARKQSEIILLSMKCFHATLFIVTACLSLSSAKQVIGTDLPITMMYAFAATFFWIEYKLFLTIPILSSVASIAMAVAPRPMKMYFYSGPFILALTTCASFIVVPMCYQQGKTPSPEVLATLHIELSGIVGCILLMSHTITMTLILRRFSEMRSSTKQDSGSINQITKLGNVEAKIRKLRNETLFLAMTFSPSLIIYGAVDALKQLSGYFAPLAWAVCGVITLRYIYLSHLTVEIHLKRSRTDPLSTPQASPEEEEDKLAQDLTRSRGTSDITPFHSTEVSPMAAISKIARRRKKRKPKYVNAMTRVEEEKTAVATRVEETFTVMETNDASRSNVG